MFYFGAERHNSRDFPREKCRRPRVFGQGEELQLGDSQRVMNIPKTPVCQLNFSQLRSPLNYLLS